MKKSKMVMIGGFVIATVAGFAFKPATPVKGEFDVTRYRNITNCPGVTCKPLGSTTCNGFFQNQNCTSPISEDLNYTP